MKYARERMGSRSYLAKVSERKRTGLPFVSLGRPSWPARLSLILGVAIVGTSSEGVLGMVMTMPGGGSLALELAISAIFRKAKRIALSF